MISIDTNVKGATAEGGVCAGGHFHVRIDLPGDKTIDVLVTGESLVEALGAMLEILEGDPIPMEPHKDLLN